MKAFICENCNTEFRKVFSFNSDGDNTQYFECPNCGEHTRPKEITFTEEGNVILAKNKDGKPTLAYQVANPEDEKTYGGIIKIKQDEVSDNKKPTNKGKKKPYNKESKDKKQNDKKRNKPFHKKIRKEKTAE